MRAIWTLALVLTFVPPAFGQTKTPTPDKEKESLRPVYLQINFLLETGKQNLNFTENLPQNWESRFLPPKKNMAFETRFSGQFMSFGIELEPRLAAGKWEIGFPISYSTSNLLAADNGYLVSRTTLYWFDPVPLQKRRLDHRFLPSLGISVTRSIVTIQSSIQPFSLKQIEYAGRDCINCRNSSFTFSEIELDRGLSKNLAVDFRFTKFDPENKARLYGSMGVFVEHINGSMQLIGFKLKFSGSLISRFRN